MATFEERLQRLEQIGEALRRGNQPIDQAMQLFEEGVKLAKALEQELAKIDRRIEIVVGDASQGEAPPALEPFAFDSAPVETP